MSTNAPKTIIATDKAVATAESAISLESFIICNYSNN